MRKASWTSWRRTAAASRRWQTTSPSTGGASMRSRRSSRPATASSPVTLEELRQVTDVWVDAALRLTPADLRKMERLAAAQDRRCNIPAPGALVAAE